MVRTRGLVHLYTIHHTIGSPHGHSLHRAVIGNHDIPSQHHCATALSRTRIHPDKAFHSPQGILLFSFPSHPIRKCASREMGNEPPGVPSEETNSTRVSPTTQIVKIYDDPGLVSPVKVVSLHQAGHDDFAKFEPSSSRRVSRTRTSVISGLHRSPPMASPHGAHFTRLSEARS